MSVQSMQTGSPAHSVVDREMSKISVTESAISHARPREVPHAFETVEDSPMFRGKVRTWHALKPKP